MNIKKTALALGSALMVFATTLNAQEQPWSLGVKTGGGMSWLNGLGDKKFDSNDSTASYNWIGGGGLTASYAFHENVGVGLEVLYTSLGGQTKEKLSSDSTGTTAKAEQFNIRTHNLVIPLMVKLFPMGCDPETGILDIHLGMQGVLPLFGANVEKSKSDDHDKLEKDKDFKKDFLRPLTIDGIVGIGYEFPEIGLTVEGRYSHGFSDTFKDSAEAKKYREDIGLKDKKLTNRALTFSVEYNFARLLMD